MSMDETRSSTLEEIYARAREEREWWEQVLAARDAEAMTRPGIVSPDWSFKDLVAHLNGWRRRAIDQMVADRDRVARPADPWPTELNAITDEDDQLNRINAWIQDQGRQMSLDEVIAESRSHWDELYAVITTTSPEDMRDPQLFAYLDGESLEDAIMTRSLWGHLHDEHGNDIAAWLSESEG